MLICFARTAIKKKLLTLIIPLILSFYIFTFIIKQHHRFIDNFFLAVLTVFISYYFLDKNLYVEYKFLINNKSTTYKQINKTSTCFTNKINYFIEIFILSFSSLFAFLFYTRASKTSIVNMFIRFIPRQKCFISANFFAMNQTHL